LSNSIKRVVVAGGGTAGWIAAAVLAKTFGRSLEISLVESDEIPTVGVGEATIPPLMTLHKIMEVDEREFMSTVNGTFKLGVQFENWRELNHKYIHSFGYAGQDTWTCSFIHFWLAGLEKGVDFEYAEYCAELLAAREKKFAALPNHRMNYAYHLDAGRYAAFLRSYSEKFGATRIEGKIDEVNIDAVDGHIKSLRLASGRLVEGDFFIDCTGFRGLLIEGALHEAYEDWSHWLPCDRAIAVQTESVEDPVPYTRSIARDSGWQWRIPLQTRVGNGLVYSSKYIDDDSAKDALLNNVQGAVLTSPKIIKFRTGNRRHHWVKNCLALGLSSGFIEPLESTSIHLMQRNIIRFIQLFPVNGVQQVDIDEFNNQSRLEVERIRDFIILHYKVTNREDTPFWRYCKNMDIPDALRQRINLFSKTGRVFKIENELFGEESWMQVMMGQGILPKKYHPVVDAMTGGQLRDFLGKIRSGVRHKVNQLPQHKDFINYYCKSKM
jgi:tryptophan halogenase